MRTKRFLAIDISPDEIKLGQFCTKNSILYIIALKSFNTLNELSKHLQAKRLKGLNVIGSLGGVPVITRSLTFSSVANIDFEKEILRNIKEQIPTIGKDENVIIKYQILSREFTGVKETIDVLAAVAKKNAVTERIELLKGLNLIPCLIDAGNASLFLPFVALYDKNISTALINIKREKTDVIIVQNGYPYLVSEIEVGEREFLHSKTLFFHRITSALDFYHTGNNGRKDIRKIIIMGKSEERIKTYFEKKFDFPVERANLEKISLIRFNAKFEDVTSYVHIIGLGLKKIYPALFEINFISAPEKEIIEFDSLKRNLKKISLLITSIFTFIALLLLLTNLFYSLNLHTFSKRIKGLQTKLNKVDTFRTKNKLLQEKIAKIEPLLKNETEWDKVLFEISKLTPKDVWLESIKSSSKLKKKENEDVIKEKLFTIEGQTLEQAKIDHFVSKLEDSPLFSSVQIDKIEKKENISFKLKLLLK